MEQTRACELANVGRIGNIWCRRRRYGQRLTVALAALLGLALSGCAALTNPVADGIPVRYVRPELLAKPKDNAQTIPLDLLGQPTPAVYRLAPEDVLGIWIEGVVGENTKGFIPVNPASTTVFREQRRLPPSAGYPIAVREDGTIRLPLIDPIKVQGLSVSEAEDAIRKIYVDKKLLPLGKEQILVSLMYQRATHIVVLRQESGNITLGPAGGLAGGKRSTGHQIDLPAYENDVLHALANTGGLPGLDAYNDIIIFRNSSCTPAERAALLEKIKALPPGADPTKVLGCGAPSVKIPIRLDPGEEIPFGPQDVLLHTGDVVFIEARDPDLFYTSGLLPAGEHVLPRDYDLNVIKAITRSQGPLINGAFNTNNLAGNLIAPGVGGPSPALLTVVRQTPDGRQVSIRVDLQRAMRDPRERIIVWPGDVLVLQEKPCDAVTRYTVQTLFNFNLLWKVVSGNGATGVINVATPERLATPAVTTLAQ